MTTLSAIAVILAIIYIYVLVRPINYNMAYTATVQNMKLSLVINSSKTMTLKLSSDGNSAKIDFYIITNGRQVGQLGIKGDGTNGTLSEEDYKTAVEEFKALSQAEQDEFWASENAITMGLFAIYDNDSGETYLCGGMIAFVIVMGIVTIATIVASKYSYKLYMQEKNTQQNVIEEKTENNDNQEIKQEEENENK